MPHRKSTSKAGPEGSGQHQPPSSSEPHGPPMSEINMVPLGTRASVSILETSSITVSLSTRQPDSLSLDPPTREGHSIDASLPMDHIHSSRSNPAESTPSLSATGMGYPSNNLIQATLPPAPPDRTSRTWMRTEARHFFKSEVLSEDYGGLDPACCQAYTVEGRGPQCSRRRPHGADYCRQHETMFLAVCFRTYLPFHCSRSNPYLRVDWSFPEL
jgi:hypothetical protein